MSMTLSFVERVFNMGRNLEKLGSLAEASQTYQRLVGIKPLPDELAHEIPGTLGKLQFERGQYAKARRNLALALARRPDCAEYLCLLAKAIEADETCDLGRAEKAHRKCVRLEPHNPRRLIDLAHHLMERGQSVEALELLQQAGDVGTDDLEIVRAVAAGMRELDELDEAHRLLHRAQFRHGKNPRFQQVWNEHRFQQLRASQQATRNISAEETPILRFVPKPIAV